MTEERVQAVLIPYASAYQSHVSQCKQCGVEKGVTTEEIVEKLCPVGLDIYHTWWAVWILVR